MTIEEYIKAAMIKCPLTKEQEGALLKGLENYLDEIELVKTNFTPNEAESERLKCLMEDAKPNCDCKLNQCMKKGW